MSAEAMRKYIVYRPTLTDKDNPAHSFEEGCHDGGSGDGDLGISTCRCRIDSDDLSSLWKGRDYGDLVDIAWYMGRWLGPSVKERC